MFSFIFVLVYLYPLSSFFFSFLFIYSNIEVSIQFIDKRNVIYDIGEASRVSLVEFYAAMLLVGLVSVALSRRTLLDWRWAWKV